MKNYFKRLFKTGELQTAILLLFLTYAEFYNLQWFKTIFYEAITQGFTAFVFIVLELLLTPIFTGGYLYYIYLHYPEYSKQEENNFEQVK